ncbi:flavin-containing monooxygenase FMO GS-OX3-like isoform X2 [Diprion similis]|uniref:flavin-containing monooxygenase FMO GS-OX3-like isoform X2 n=1 Tax=Diprion similis TaxID=362088 RepID=UPI001EF94E5A|nr:flavin-containing monooxygenase FMO GS-OX3-like isoform X2 [Diprion similis]
MSTLTDFQFTAACTRTSGETKTNVPKEIMQIPDFPFKDQDGPSFVHHSVVRHYLWSYTKHFNLFPHIKLNTLVKHVEPEGLPSGQTLWLVTSKDLESNVVMTRTFDAAILCNGHYTVGHVPHIPGIETFPGKSIHSHQYRKPETYANKKVCILGASWSGLDIAIEVSKYADKIYLSHNLADPKISKLPKNVKEVAGIDRIHGSTFVFKTGVTAVVEEFIYCTGYQFTYPFLSEKVNINTKDNHVEPVYKYLVHTDVQNLFFMGLPGLAIPFPMFHLQAQYILKIIDGRVKLPSSSEMREDIQREKRKLLQEGIPARHIIKLKDRQWAYYDDIATTAGVPSFPPVIRKIWDHTCEMRDQDLTTYKNYRYHIVDRENFTVDYYKPC